MERVQFASKLLDGVDRLDGFLSIQRDVGCAFFKTHDRMEGNRVELEGGGLRGEFTGRIQLIDVQTG